MKKHIFNRFVRLAAKESPEKMAILRQNRYYYSRKKLVNSGLPPASFIPSYRATVLYLVPFKNWTIAELVSLNRAIGQTVNFYLDDNKITY